MSMIERQIAQLLRDNTAITPTMAGSLATCIVTFVDADRARAAPASEPVSDEFGQKVTSLIAEICKAKSMAWRDSLVEDLVELIEPSPTTPAKPSPVKDHVLREVVNNLRDIAIKFHGAGQLRERLRGALDPLLLPANPPSLTPERREDEADALTDLRKAVSDKASDEWLLGFVRQYPFRDLYATLALPKAPEPAQQSAPACPNCPKPTPYGPAICWACMEAQQSAHAEDAKEIAKNVAREVLHHIDTMYPGMWAPVAKTARLSIKNTIIGYTRRFASMLDKGNAVYAARYRYIEENCTTQGGGKGFTITCFVPIDSEDMGCGIDVAVAAELASAAGKDSP